MTINDALNWGFAILKEKNIDSYHLDTELILCFTIKKKKEWILTNPNFRLNINQIKRFKKLILKRSKYYPIAYILGHKYFFGLKFKVNKNVLIPRPETEILVDECLKIKSNNLVIADIGTGSGCIAISIAKNINNTNIISSDNSKLALNIAKKNARLNNVANIKFIKSDLLNNLKNENIDIIIANLPYVSQSWDEKSIKYEPYNALYSGKSGLVHYFKLLKQVKELKHLPQYIFLEIDPQQVNILNEKIKDLFKNCDIKIKKDLRGLDRVMIIKLL